MTVHFVGLKLICHVSSHFSSAVRSSRRRCLSWSFWITLKTALLSANSFDEDDLMTSGRSLMKAKNNSGPSNVPSISKSKLILFCLTSARPLIKSATINLISNYMTMV